MKARIQVHFICLMVTLAMRNWGVGMIWGTSGAGGGDIRVNQCGCVSDIKV